MQEPAAAGVFDDEYRQFFVRYNEPPHIKHLKVGLLPYLSNGDNARDVCTELNEYVTGVDSELSKCALQALGKIALRLEPIAEELVDSLMKMVDLDIPYVRIMFHALPCFLASFLFSFVMSLSLSLDLLLPVCIL